MSNNIELIDSLKKDINKLEFQIKHFKLTSFKNKGIRNLKITGCILQFTMPYVLSVGICFSGWFMLGDIPFYRNKVKQSKHVMYEFDNHNQILYQQKYGLFDNETNRLYHYSKWEKLDDGLYQRTIDEYQLTSSYENLITLINDEHFNIESVMLEPNSSIVEVRNNLSYTELLEEDYIKVFLYDVINDDYIIIKQNVDDNILLSGVFIICSIISLMLASGYRNISKFKIKDCLQELYKKYTDLNIETLQKLLTIKRDNYECLTR